jgi:hypothetical protein
MASITISDVRPVGADLFLDSESFLIELKDTDSIMGNINGASISVFTLWRLGHHDYLAPQLA